MKLIQISRYLIIIDYTFLQDLDSGVQGDYSENGRAAAVLRRATSFKRSEIPHDYCFVEGRHAGSTYLKFGTAGGYLFNCLL